MRPKTPFAMENSVGEPAAHAAPNAGIGKESVANSHPRFVPVRSKDWTGTFFFGSHLG